MIDKINELIESIPYELRECFAIEIKAEDGLKLEKELHEMYIEVKEFHFPLTIREINVYIGESYYPTIKVLPKYEYVNKVYLYEINQFKNFIKEYEKLTNKYNCYIGACGCCSSPYILDFYTISIYDIQFKEDKIIYDLCVKPFVENILHLNKKEPTQ